MAGSKDITTVTYEDFGDGIDLRGGILTRSAKKFYALVNYLVTNGRKIKMRPPLREYPGSLDTVNTQGCDDLNGRIVTIAKLGAVVTNTIAGVDTLYFDNPEGATTWELLEMVTYNEVVCAIIRHTFPSSGACRRRNFLHVFDGERATYVTDPALPQSWSPGFPVQPYGAGTRGAYRDYTPRLSVIADRLAITTAAGDVAFCAVGLPRVWNTLAPSEILANGEMWYHILDTTVTAQYFTVPVPYTDLILDARCSAYVCEYLGADGVWVQFTESAFPSTEGTYGIASVVNRFDASKPNETRVTIKPSSETPDGTPVRFRAIADPTVTVVSGLTLTTEVINGQVSVAQGSVIGGTMSHEGKSYFLSTVKVPSLTTPGEMVRVNVAVPGSPVPIPTITTAELDVHPINGQQRYWSRTVAEVLTSDSENVHLDKCRVIRIDGEYYIILSGSSSGGVAAPLVFTDVNTATPLITPGTRIRVGSAALFTVIERYTSTTTIRTLTDVTAGVLRVDVISGISTITVGSSFSTSSGTWTNKPPQYFWYDNIFNGNYTYALDGVTTIATGSTVLVGSDGSDPLYARSNYLIDLTVGESVEVNGETRKVVGISSDVLAEVDRPFTASGTYVALRDPRYLYASDIGDTGNEWYATTEANITLKGAGKDDALVIGTSNYDPSGALPVAIATMDNRMLVQYPSVIQSWAVGESVSDFSRLATMGQGAGSNTRPQPVLLDGYAGLPTSNGPRMFAPMNNNKDYIDFVSVGDMLRSIALPDLNRAVWWPQMRVWITCAGSGDDGRMFVLSSHRDTKVLAWATWRVPGLTVIDAMFVRGNNLVVKSGAKLYYFDPDATSFVDAVGGQIVATARWLYNDLGSPQRNKKLIRCEVVQTGTCEIGIHVNPRSLTPPLGGAPAAGDTVDGPTVRGTTVGMQRFPVMAMGPGIGLEVTSHDPAGHELDQIGFDYILLNR